MTEPPVPIGTGIYSQPEAARLLKMTPSRLRRWVNGYTYWLHGLEETRRRQRPPVIVKTDLPVVDDTVALSFLELMELRVVKALVDAGIPLQTVRAAARIARDSFRTRHPFATRGTFVEGRRSFVSVSQDPGDADVVELHRSRHVQVTMGQVLEPFLMEIEFDAATSLAHRWWPLGPGQPVVLDPAIAFGAPVIQGSRVRTNIAASMAGEDSPELAAEALGVSVLGIETAVRFEAYLTAA